MVGGDGNWRAGEYGKCEGRLARSGDLQVAQGRGGLPRLGAAVINK